MTNRDSLKDLKKKRLRLTKQLIEINQTIASYNPNKKQLEMKENLDALREIIPNFDEKVKKLSADKKVTFTDKDDFMEYFSKHSDEWDSLFDELENFE